MSSYTMIRLKRSTHKRLTEFGKKGETYDDVINKLIKYAEERK